MSGVLVSFKVNEWSLQQQPLVGNSALAPSFASAGPYNVTLWLGTGTPGGDLKVKVGQTSNQLFTRGTSTEYKWFVRLPTLDYEVRGGFETLAHALHFSILSTSLLILSSLKVKPVQLQHRTTGRS